MKDVITSLKTAVTERIKNPLIGTFILSWLFYSRIGVTNFLLGDNEVKRAIITGYSLEWGDILVPALMTFIYVAINQIILPFVQHHIDKFKLKHVEQQRFEHRADLSKANSKSEAEANKEKFKATLSYAGKLADKELLDWADEKEKFETEVSQLNVECDDLDLEVRNLTDERDELAKEKISLNAQLKKNNAYIRQLNEEVNINKGEAEVLLKANSKLYEKLSTAESKFVGDPQKTLTGMGVGTIEVVSPL